MGALRYQHTRWSWCKIQPPGLIPTFKVTLIRLCKVLVMWSNGSFELHWDKKISFVIVFHQLYHNPAPFIGPAVLPDVSLHAALSPELVLHEICVVRGGDEVMAQWLAHVLEDAPPLWVEDGAIW